MTSALRVISFGLGPIGQAAARLAASKSTIELVGAIDVDADKVGRDVGELLGLDEKLGVVVEEDAAATLQRLQPDAVIHCTTSFIPDVIEQLELIARCGANVVSSSEELLVPDLQHADLVPQIDSVAREAGVSVLGTGVNPGFAMDFIAIVASAVTFDVRGARCVRVVDAATRRLPLQKKIGAGMSESEWKKQLASGRFGHIGLRESVALVARGLGLEVDRIEQTVDPVVAAEDHKTPFLVVKEGQVAGIRNHGYGYIGEQVVVHLDLSMFVGAPEPLDEVILDSTPPVHLKFRGGIAGDEATAAMLVNNIHGVVAARPGLVSVLDVAPPRLCL